MLLLEVLEKVYGRNKKGELSHYAIKFCEKHNLSLEKENSIEDMLVAFSMLSNKEKREIAIRMVYAFIEKEKKSEEKEVIVENKNIELLDIRNMTYKQACRLYHPDNKSTGNEGIFKFIQDVKMAFWDYKGNPREQIEEYSWERERKIIEDGVPFFYNLGK